MVRPKHNSRHGPIDRNKIDMEKMHQLFMDGIPYRTIAKELNIGENQCLYLIECERDLDEGKWPYRQKYEAKPMAKKKEEQIIVQKPKVKIEATYKREPLSTEPANGKCKSFHISTLPQAEQDRMMNAKDPKRKKKPAFGGGWGMLP